MRVAISFSGLPRIKPQALAAWQRMISQHDCHVYMHVWNTDIEEISVLLQRLKPVACSIEPPIVFDVSCYTERLQESNPQSVFSMWTSISRSMSLVESSCIQYDRVVRARFDVGFDDFDFLDTSSEDFFVLYSSKISLGLISSPVFDLIIGNPPYFVCKKSDVPKEYSEFIYGRPNIFGLFIIHSLSLIKPGGIIAFIIPKSFLNSLYYSKIRNYIKETCSIVKIDDYSSFGKLITNPNNPPYFEENVSSILTRSD